ncbi:MAG: tetratricopeptide repeat protein [Bacteroidales bacterium]|nr:tetratricopeptide repeat protein [Bacteroidales bacterium]
MMHQPVRKLKVKRLIFLLTVVLTLGGGSFLLHHYQERRQAGTLRDRAEAAVAEKDWETASSLYKSYLNYRPGDIAAIAGYADCLEQQSAKKPALARQTAIVREQLVRLDPHRLADRKKLAQHYLENRHYPNAREHLAYLLSPSEGGLQNDANILEMAAQCEARDGRNFTEAVKYLERALQTGHASTDAYLHLALTLQKEINTPEAQERAAAVVAELIAAKPDDVNARLARAQYYVQTSEPTKARIDIDHAYELPGGNKNPDVLLARAELAIWTDDLPSAKSVLTQATAALPDDLRLRLRLAEVLERLNELEAARKVLAATPQPDKLSDVASVEIADRLLDLGDSSAALHRAEQLQKAPDTQFLADYLLGRVRLSQGDWPAARTLLKASTTALARMPGYHLKALLGIGQCYSLAGNPDQQLAAFSAARQINPASVPAQLGQADALAKLGRAASAIAIYRSLMAAVPGARAPLCRLRLAEILAQPESARKWDTLTESYGPAPYPPEIELVRSSAAYFHGQPAEAETILTESIQRTPNDARLHAALAVLRGEKKPADGLTVLADAEKTLGDQLPLRLARAQLLARNPDTPASAVTALAENSAGFSRADRHQLASSLGAVLASLGHRSAAIDLYSRAVAELPFDIASRIALFDLALMEKRTALVSRMMDEIGKLDGADGPSHLMVEVARGITTIQPGDKAAMTALRDKLQHALARRESWGRLFVLQGDLDMLDSQPDAALQNYRQAMAHGERTDFLVRKLVRLLLDRQHHPEALAILTRVGQESVLAPDMAKQLVLLKSVMSPDRDQNLNWARSGEMGRSRDYRDHLFRATVFAVNNAPQEAKAALQKAVTLNDTAPEPWVALVRFLAANGQKTEAMAAYQQATQKLRSGKKPLGPDAAVIPLTLGACLELLGELGEAEKLYREAYTLAPTDPGTVRQLVLLLQSTNRKAEAQQLLEATMAEKHPPAVRRWARRMLAFTLIAGPEGYTQVPAALALIDQNLQEGGNLLDDQRAKSLVQAADPFQRADAIAGLTESAKTVPLGPEENFLLAKLYLQNGVLDQAETYLQLATQSGGLASAEHLALLTKVQLERGNTTAARSTINRLKLAAAGSWTAVAEEARYLARTGKKEEAGKLAFSAAAQDEAAHLLARVGPLLEEIDCPAEAEKAYRQYAGLVTRPDAHVPLASFYLRQGRPAEAIALARSRAADCPVGTTARLLSGAVRSRPPELVQAADKGTWDQTVTNAVAWVDAKLSQEPDNADLLFARAELHDAVGRFDDEVRAYEAALLRAPDQEVYLNNLALLLAVHNHDASARPLDLINRAIAKRGPQPYFLDTRAVVHTVAGRLEEARRDLEVAISLAPRPVYFFHLALTHDKSNQTQPRDAALAEAVQRGLTKAMLHPKEWGEYERLVGSQKK